MLVVKLKLYLCSVTLFSSLFFLVLRGWLVSLAQLKGTVSVILSDPPCKEGNARFTTIPLKPNQICGRYRRFPGSKSHISETANEI